MLVTQPEATTHTKARKETKPLVSILTITYNHEGFIGQALESFVAQKTNFDFEVLVADDCSTDGTADVIREYAKKYPKIIKPILRPKNIGPEENFLSTAELVQGKYVAICDGDDYFIDDRKLQKQIDILEADETLSVCYGMAKMVWEDGSRETSLKPTREPDHIKARSTIKDLLHANYMPTSTIVYRWRFGKDNIRTHMPVRIQPGDYYLMLLHAEVGDIAFLDEVLSVYRRHTSGTWYNFDTSMEAHILKYGALELLFHYNVYKRFAHDLDWYWEQRTANFFAAVLQTFLRNGQTEKLAQLSELGPDFFAKFGQSVVIETKYARAAENGRENERRRRKRRRKRQKLIAGFFLLAILFFHLF